MTARRHCAYCGIGLLEPDARFEVRVAINHQPLPGAGVGTYCSAFCWEAAKVRISVEIVRERLHADAETVLSDEGKIFRRP